MNLITLFDVGLKPMNDERRDGLTGAILQPNEEKVSVTLQLDADILNWFIKQGDENDHINSSLRNYMESKTKQQLKLMDIREIKHLLTIHPFG